MIYLIGSLRNDQVPFVAHRLRADGHKVFDEWYAAGPGADDAWRDYEKGRGYTYQAALRYSAAAAHIYNFDRLWLEECDAAVLVLPAGKSAHLELGWMIGRGKRGYVLLDNPDRWDVMYQFATDVFVSTSELLSTLSVLRR